MTGTPDLFGARDAGEGGPGVRDAGLRAAWRDLVERRLPQAARHRPHWPVRHDHCFARILLDTVHERPWREVVPPPAWANADAARLAEAIRLGEAVLAGRVDLAALDARSLALRGKRGPAATRRRPG